MKALRSTSKSAGYAAAVAWLLFLPASPAAAELTAGQSAEDAACELKIEGKFIRRLTLENKNGHLEQIDQPGPKLSLPAGQYRVRQVDLEGGYRHVDPYSAAKTQWFTLAAGRPYQLKLGAPLRPHVKATRVGRFLELDYELLGAGGRKYSPQQPQANRPQFAVYKGGGRIGSGRFEYG